MTPLPGTPPMSEREGWLLRVAELLERIAALEAEDLRLVGLVEEACDETRRVEAERDEALARVAELEADNNEMFDEWAIMYAGRRCPKCGYHVTMNPLPLDHLAGAGKKVPR